MVVATLSNFSLLPSTTTEPIIRLQPAEPLTLPCNIESVGCWSSAGVSLVEPSLDCTETKLHSRPSIAVLFFILDVEHPGAKISNPKLRVITDKFTFILLRLI